MIAGHRVRNGSFIAIATFALCIAFFGFWFTYWKPIFTGDSFPLLLHVHAALWFGWFVLLVVQSALIQTGDRQVHMQVGVAGVVYAAIVIVISLSLALQTIGRDLHLISRSIEAVPTVIPLTQILMFALFVGLAVINWKRANLHKRLIVLAALVAVTPALARISIGLLGTTSVPFIFAISNLLIVLVGFVDWRTTGRVHPVYIRGGIAIILVRIIRIPFAMSPAWESVARSIAVMPAS